MILLRANHELKVTFDRLIETMKVPVKWNGIFAVLDNYLILQGEERSLFFHFDSRRVMTNLLEVPIIPEMMADTAQNVYLQNVLNMILYVFGKWGTIKGLRVEKNYAQLNQLFSGILAEIGVEPEYNAEFFRFYKNGMRITYEDVIQSACEAGKKEAELPEEKAQGLWHKLVWKKCSHTYEVADTTLAERQKNRIGNNFYQTGYLCPVCGGKLHMVVYPTGREFRIETEEGDVILARAYTCVDCCRFDTPQPRRLLAEGEAYCMDFAGDRTAYEDYQELLGRNGERVSNYNYNEYANKRADVPGKEAEAEAAANAELAQLEAAFDGEMLPELSGLSDGLFKRLFARIEEGFYPDFIVEKLEGQLQKEKRARRTAGKHRGPEDGEHSEAAAVSKKRQDTAQPEEAARKQQDSERSKEAAEKKENAAAQEKRQYTAQPVEAAKTQRGTEKAATVQEKRQDTAQPKEAAKTQHDAEKAAAAQEMQQYNAQSEEAAGKTEDVSVHNPDAVPEKPESGRQDIKTAAEEKYHARVHQFERLSERQRRELKSQLAGDASLADSSRQQLLTRIHQLEQAEGLEKLRQQTERCKDKPYAVVQRVYEEVKEADIPEADRQPLLEKLEAWLQTKGVQEQERQREIQTQKITSIIRQARTNRREDLTGLLERLEEQNFLPELVQPYEEKIKEKLCALDKDAISAICEAALDGGFEEAEEALEKVENGTFLPELKSDAVKLLKKRLAKIKTEECELLVQKLREALDEAKLGGNPKHYFYPARKVLMKQASQEETGVIAFAKASYGAGMGEFEYPIMVVDTSHNGSGEKGMFLTPEKLYYSNLMTSYHISVFSIERVEAVTGLLNRGLYVYQKDGTKLRLPSAVETAQLPKFAGVLEAYIKYLQEKPFSRKETYLAKEKHETICCFRCGFVYRGGTVCPKCGYQRNE